jgi:hypothetical protein
LIRANAIASAAPREILLRRSSTPSCRKGLRSIKPTAENKGLEMNITLKTYDNGQVYLDGVPMNGKYPEVAWASAIEVLAGKVRELQLKVRNRAQ